MRIPMNTVNTIAGAMAAFLGTMSLGAILTAGDAQAQARPDGWFKLCSKQDKNDICNTQIQSVASTGQVVTAISLIDVKGEINRRVFQITVPSGRLIPAGIKLRVDDKSETTLPYLYCFPQSCIAEVKMDDNLIKLLKSGGKLMVTSTNVQNKPNPIEITLNGFTAVYDGPPIQQEELANKQQELADELRKKAEETRKKLQEAQDAAKSGTAN